jgi:hypothetical protein
MKKYNGKKRTRQFADRRPIDDPSLRGKPGG